MIRFRFVEKSKTNTLRFSRAQVKRIEINYKRCQKPGFAMIRIDLFLCTNRKEIPRDI